MSELQVVIFNINGQAFGAEANQVFQIIKYQEPAKIPKMPKFIDGMINFRDTVIPVVNLARRFDMGEFLANKKTKILVARIEDKFVGYVVNDVTEIVKFADGEVDDAPAIMQTAAASYLKKVGKKGNDLISIIDLEKVLNDSEIKKLNLIH